MSEKTTAEWERQGGGAMGPNGTFVFGCGIGVVIALMGAFFCAALWIGYMRAMETRGWPEVECVLTKSEVRAERPTPNSPMAYLLDLEYQFSYEGNQYTGTKRKRVNGPTSKVDRARAWRDELPMGTVTRCWVNPEDPAGAVLEHGSKAALYSIWFPGLFLLGGLGIMFASVRRRFLQK